MQGLDVMTDFVGDHVGLYQNSICKSRRYNIPRFGLNGS